MGISDGSQHLQWVFEMDPNICNGYFRWIAKCLKHPALNIRYLRWIAKCLKHPAVWLWLSHCNTLQHTATLWSQSALNIRPAPGQTWFTVGQCGWWEYDCNFRVYSCPSLNLFSPNSNTKSLCDCSSRHVVYVLLRITGLFCKRALQKRLYSAKETCNFMEPSWEWALHFAQPVVPAISPIAAH